MADRRVVLLGVVASALMAAATMSSHAQSPQTPTADARGELRAVVELFTSQGCSSCPAADKLLGELAKDPTLVALTIAIDTWDYLGWKDTLAIAGHASRQKAYSKVRGDREVYTPQAIINGTVQAVGSDRAAIERAIVASKKTAGTLSIPVTLSVANGQVTVSAPASRDNVSGEVWLCPLAKKVPVAIQRGENSGQTITYHNVVRKWVRLGVWTGKAETWSVPVAEIKADDVDAIAVVLQLGKAQQPGAMLGGAIASLK